MTTRTHAVLKIQVSFLEIETKAHLLRYKQLDTNVSFANILHYLSGCSSIPCIVNSLKSITSPIPREGSWQFLSFWQWSWGIKTTKPSRILTERGCLTEKSTVCGEKKKGSVQTGFNGRANCLEKQEKLVTHCAGGYIRNIWEQITKVWTTKDACQRDMGKGLTMR